MGIGSLEVFILVVLWVDVECSMLRTTDDVGTWIRDVVLLTTDKTVEYVETVNVHRVAEGVSDARCKVTTMDVIGARGEYGRVVLWGRRLKYGSLLVWSRWLKLARWLEWNNGVLGRDRRTHGRFCLWVAGNRLNREELVSLHFGRSDRWYECHVSRFGWSLNFEGRWTRRGYARKVMETLLKSLVLSRDNCDGGVSIP
jgi:hypothetical protein